MSSQNYSESCFKLQNPRALALFLFNVAGIHFSILSLCFSGWLSAKCCGGSEVPNRIGAILGTLGSLLAVLANLFTLFWMVVVKLWKTKRMNAWLFGGWMIVGILLLGAGIFTFVYVNEMLQVGMSRTDRGPVAIAGGLQLFASTFAISTAFLCLFLKKKSRVDDINLELPQIN